jgi:hypothetical protein
LKLFVLARLWLVGTFNTIYLSKQGFCAAGGTYGPHFYQL